MTPVSGLEPWLLPTSLTYRSDRPFELLECFLLSLSSVYLLCPGAAQSGPRPPKGLGLLGIGVNSIKVPKRAEKSPPMKGGNELWS